jgi:hypothetical protein
MPDNTPTLPAFLGLDFAQWAVILREVIKSAGVVLVATGVWTAADASSFSLSTEYLLKGLQFFGGGSIILLPMIYQIWQRAAVNRIRDVASLPQVKGIVTDAKTAHQDLKNVPNVVSNATEIPKEKIP